VLAQLLLVLADPGDLPVGAEQQRRHVRGRRAIRDDVDPVRPAPGGQPLGAAERQAAAPAQPNVGDRALAATFEKAGPAGRASP
jgi:hypothetical protein